MKKLNVTYLSLLFIVAIIASCSQSETITETKIPQKRKSSSEKVDLRDVGELHNLMLDCAKDFLAENNGESSEANEPICSLKPLEARLSNLLIESMPDWMECSSASIIDVMNHYINYYSSDVVPTVADSITPVGPIEMEPYEPVLGDSLYSIDPSINLPENERIFLERIANIAKDETGHYISNNALEERIKELKTKWEKLYGEDGYNIVDEQNIASGVCLCIMLSSYDWWKNYKSLSFKNKRRILPLLGYLLEKDAKGAVLGVVGSIVSGERVIKNIARDGLISGGVSSVFALF